MIRQLLHYMFVLKDLKTAEEDEKLFEIMSYDWTHVDPVLTMKIARTAGKAKCSIVDVIDKGYDFFIEQYERNDVSAEQFAGAESFIVELQELLQSDAKMVFTEWFEHLLNTSGYLDFILSVSYTHLDVYKRQDQYWDNPASTAASPADRAK